MGKLMIISVILLICGIIPSVIAVIATSEIRKSAKLKVFEAEEKAHESRKRFDDSMDFSRKTIKNNKLLRIHLSEAESKLQSLEAFDKMEADLARRNGQHKETCYKKCKCCRKESRQKMSNINEVNKLIKILNENDLLRTGEMEDELIKVKKEIAKLKARMNTLRDIVDAESERMKNRSAEWEVVHRNE